MRLSIISDLHVDSNARALQSDVNFQDLLAKALIEKETDVLLLAGDVMNDYMGVDAFIKGISDRVGIPVYFVAGNHDLWQMNAAKRTSAIKILDFFKSQPYNLVNSPKTLENDFVLVGNPGWYDYGYADQSKYTEEEFANKKYRFAEWNDKNYIDFGKYSDKEVSRVMGEELEADMKGAEGKKIILMTHVATHPEFVVPLPHKLYDYVNAFLGAKSYEGLYQDNQVIYNIMGHVHLRKVLEDNNTTHIMASLGNNIQWQESNNPYKEILNTMYTIDI